MWAKTPGTSPLTTGPSDGGSRPPGARSRGCGPLIALSRRTAAGSTPDGSHPEPWSVTSLLAKGVAWIRRASLLGTVNAQESRHGQWSHQSILCWAGVGVCTAAAVLAVSGSWPRVRLLGSTDSPKGGESDQADGADSSSATTSDTTGKFYAGRFWRQLPRDLSRQRV